MRRHVGIAAAAAAIVAAGLLVQAVCGAAPRAATAPAGETPAVLLEKGIYLEETAGDIEAAVKTYRKIVEEGRETRKVAAEAQYRLARCYLKLKKPDLAAAALQALARDYPEQKELQAKAQALLPKPPPVSASRLEFRIAPFAPSSGAKPALGEGGLKEYMDWLKDGRIGAWWSQHSALEIPARTPNYIWMPIRGDANGYRNQLVVGEYQGRSYLLVCDEANQVMAPSSPSMSDGAIKRMSVEKDNSARPVVGLEFDEKGAERFAALTGENLHAALAILVDGEVLSAPIIQSKMGKAAQITGNFTQQEVNRLVQSIQAGMAAARPVDAARARAIVEGMRALMGGVYKAVDANAPETALTLLQQEIEQGKELLEVVRGTPAEAAVKAGLPMLERIEAALKAKDYPQARQLLGTMDAMGPALDRSIKEGLDAAAKRSSADSAGAPGEVYIMGDVDRPGVYSITARQITVKMMLAAAGYRRDANGGPAAAEVSRLEEEIRSLEKELDAATKLRRMSDTHPTVVALREKIALTKGSLAKAGERTAASSAGMAILIRRGPDGNEARITLSIARLLSGDEKDQVLQPNDLLIVGAASAAESQPTAVEKREAESLAADGWRLWNDRKLPEAEAKFLAAVAKDPGSANAWNGLGWAQQGKPLNAKASFQRAVAIDPNLGGAWNGLGWLARSEGKTNDAIAYWKKALDVMPNATAALAGLASTYMEMKQYDKAVQYYEAAAKADPNDADIKPGLEAARKAAASQPASAPRSMER